MSWRGAGIFAAATYFCLISGMAWAGGMITYEINSPGTGSASAGWAALAQDASTAFTNPAGMTRLKQSQLLVGAQPVIITADFSAGSGTRVLGGGDPDAGAGVTLPSMGGYYVHSVSDRFKLGISSLSYFGAGLDYGNDWVGRYRVEKTAFLTASLAPSVAYRVNDWLSVGALFNVMLGYMKSETAINNAFERIPDGQLKYKDTDFGFGGGAGILIEPTPCTRIGVMYYSPVELSFNDAPSFDGLGPILGRLLARRGVIGRNLEMSFTVPQWVMVSGYQQVTDRLALMANFGWQNWSRFGDVDIALQVESGAQRDVTANLRMKDTWHGAIGAQYRIARPWLLSVGFAYDSSPFSTANRTPSMPLDRTLRYAAGIQYDCSQRLTVGLAYEFMDFGSAKIDKAGGPFVGSLVGDYDSYNANIVNLNVIYKF